MYFKPGLQVILNDVRYHKYHHRNHHWQIPCQNVAVDTRRRQSFYLVPFSNPNAGK